MVRYCDKIKNNNGFKNEITIATTRRLSTLMEAANARCL